MKLWLFFVVIVMVLIASGSPESRPAIVLAIIVGAVWFIKVRRSSYRTCEPCDGTGWRGSDKAARPCRPCKGSGRRRRFLAGRDNREDAGVR